MNIDQTLEYLRDQLHWPIPEDDELDKLTFEYDAAELGLKSEQAQKLTDSKIFQLRPLPDAPRQPFGIFLIQFNQAKLPIVLSAESSTPSSSKNATLKTASAGASLTSSSSPPSANTMKNNKHPNPTTPTSYSLTSTKNRTPTKLQPCASLAGTAMIPNSKSTL